MRVVREKLRCPSPRVADSLRRPGDRAARRRGSHPSERRAPAVVVWPRR